MNKFRLLVLLMMVLLSNFSLKAQSISLDSCISYAERNYPLWQQNDLLNSSLELSLANIGKNLWPQINLNGQYTYQSDVTGLPVNIPNLNIPTIDKNQYKVFLDINQSVYDGGMTNASKSVASINTELDRAKLKVDIYKVREKVSQLYFGILMLKERNKQLEVSRADLQSNLEKMENLVENEAALSSNADVFKAELIKLEQRIIETKHDETAYIKLLNLLTGLNIQSDFEFLMPVVEAKTEINRPELQVFYKQQALFMAQENSLKSKMRPKVNLFLQTGFGKPALNMLSNETQGYYIGGLRFSMPLSSLYTYKNERSLLDAYKLSVEYQKETFLLNTNMGVEQENEELAKYRELLEKDDELIRLRVSIKNIAQQQLDNGVITVADYLREQNAEESARLNKSLHMLQYEIHLYTINLIKGN